MPEITVGFKTDVGRVRALNQDSLAVILAAELEGRAQGLFIVADGVGGNRRSGEVASRMAVQIVTEAIRAALTTADILPPPALEELIATSLKAANAAVWQQGKRVYEQQGMGTTCVLALVRDTNLIVGNVGDSRCYLLRNGFLDQITNDHAFLDMGRGSRASEDESGSRLQFRHVMTRAIGYASVVEPEVESFRLREGDTLLLCSDGLTKQLDQAEIAALVTRSETPQMVCEKLVAAANAKGGDDNITVIMAHYGIVPTAQAQEANPADAACGVKTSDGDRVTVGPGVNSWRRRLRRLLKR